jgi:hypothetical protein
VGRLRTGRRAGALLVARAGVSRAIAAAGVSRAAAALAVAAGVGGVVGCSSPSAASAAGALCGSTRTGANVSVVIKVTKGNVDCGTVMRVEESYAALIRKGDIRGNGGGAPVGVSGWTCQGYPTPEVLRTGYTSECHTTSAEVVAVLALPSSSPSSGPSSSPSSGPSSGPSASPSPGS